MTGTGDVLPRQIGVGPLTLDLFHRDAQIGTRWLGLFPREFALLWRLAESPGQRLDRMTLLADVWRLDHDPETNRLEVHVARLRAKLHDYRLAGIIVTDPAGGYRLESEVTWPGHSTTSFQDEGLDSYLRIGNDPAKADSGDGTDDIPHQRAGINHPRR
ncbi:winged helix-turn-helix domain-containing protein [Parerythrobacter jejuensis]|uniref:winged helix-turn-helix domain-containing protein n=1 Tax=Parerythrobacter jejuensis TaxID=795812 RepID=UPI002D7EC1D0|nr:winged helix-turn-helix domain-containing protein [Parerythrobacter jejuensis]